MKDTIYRQDAVDVLITLGDWYKDNNARRVVHQCICALYDDVPSAQPEQIYGEDIYYEADGHCEFKCSVCGVEIGVVEGGELDGGRFKFCPKCGVPIKENDDD